MKRSYLFPLGKPNESYVSAGIELFTQRASHYFPISWQIIPSNKDAASMSEHQLKEEEGKRVMALLQPTDQLILLDERGKNISSPDLARLLEKHAQQSTKNLIFLIGGAYGVSETLKNRANFVWSLSNLVFPHMLVRLLLAEQLYRACTIIRNEKYHHM
ncbi:MAG: 23S rRNA (pseudouridine(1915)-N(3))-methyltransferase RlmH [Chitinophagia bacterium]|nr:23S rRNA (pseudouridine(1915)-N(3))-methyltransferase RlmH [Chitinophagia bacterium]